ncbi:MAG: poly-gamma-glutamate biosynthesis protein [Myxococcales bacterium]|nr:poly-gamma-glutamate biosynthesis protein [Myxococcales bacterium]
MCGDVMLGRGIDQILACPCDPTLHEGYIQDARDYVGIAEDVSGPIPTGVGPEYPWGDALSILNAKRPDVRIINLETSITCSNTYEPDKGIHYRVSPQNASALEAAHIDVCALANNHVLDWGTAGLLDTLSKLDELGIARCGAGREPEEAVRPAVIELGERGRVLVFGVGGVDAGVPFSWAAAEGQPGVFVVQEFDEVAARRVSEAIEPWRRKDTIIVLSVHWGSNWGFSVPAQHRWFAHRMIDAGVHVLHGHSSHHVKGIEVREGHPILYGCGDLLTDYEGIQGHQIYRGDLGLLYLVTVDEAGTLTQLEMVPTQMRRFQVRRPGAPEVCWLANTIAETGELLGSTVALEGDTLKLRW